MVIVLVTFVSFFDPNDLSNTHCGVAPAIYMSSLFRQLTTYYINVHISIASVTSILADMWWWMLLWHQAIKADYPKDHASLS